MHATCRSRSRRIRACAPTALLCALCLTACGPAAERPVLANRDVPAELVRPCPDEPALPVAFMDDREQAKWISDAIDAGAQCRSAHAKLAEWTKDAPK